MTAIIRNDEMAILSPIAHEIRSTEAELARVGEPLAPFDRALVSERERLTQARASLRTSKMASQSAASRLMALLAGAATTVDVPDALEVADHNRRVGVEIEAITRNIDLLTREREEVAARVEAETHRLTVRLEELNANFIRALADALNERAKAEILAFADGTLKLLVQLVRQNSREALKGYRGADWLNSLQAHWIDPSSPYKVGGIGYVYPFGKRDEVTGIAEKAMAEIMATPGYEG